MIELLVLGGLALGDFVLQIAGAGGYLLLLYPPYLFFRDHSSPVLLLGGGTAALLSELLHHLVLGNLMLGVGLGLFLMHFVRDVVNWDHPVSQGFFLLFFFGTVVVTRLLLVRLLHGTWIQVNVQPYLITLLFGFGIVVLQYYRRYRVRRSL